MTVLEESIRAALAFAGERGKANKVYLEFIKANFIVPIEKTADESVRVLYLDEPAGIFLPVFTSELYFDPWAEPVKNNINLLRLSGVDLLKGLGVGVSVALNIGSDIYKEFNPAELERMKGMVLKFFST